MTEFPPFNLWSQSWLTVEWQSGKLESLSILQTLQDAHQIHALYDPSPLVVAAIHRFFVAILQDIYQPHYTEELVPIWENGRFHPQKLATFGDTYTHRFDLFSEEAPFLQTSDLGLVPAKTDNAKPAGYLFQEQTAGTAVTHYNHQYDHSQIFCAPCAAKGLLLMPAFASSGGAGIKPSINGVPPIYVFPGGDNLFQSLTASLTSKGFQPSPSKRVDDIAWWQRPLPLIVAKGHERLRVGYIDSLLFPARRVRLHPVPLPTPCARCGTQTAWGVQTMVYEMGESRPKTAPFWQDPFAAYRAPKKTADPPLPVRPVEGRALWREFAVMFLPDQANEEGLKAIRPALVDQLKAIWEEEPNILPYTGEIPWRTIGLRTDMKMKIFEWEEAGFALTPHLLTNLATSEKVKESINFARKCDGILKSTFSQYFGRGKSDRFSTHKLQMSREYWQSLGQSFTRQLQSYGDQSNNEAVFHAWLDIVLQKAIDSFDEATDKLPHDGGTLMQRQQAINHNRAKLFAYRNKTNPRSEEVMA